MSNVRPALAAARHTCELVAWCQLRCCAVQVQSFDQTFDKMNKALLVSCQKGLPVRVVRSHKVVLCMQQAMWRLQQLA